MLTPEQETKLLDLLREAEARPQDWVVYPYEIRWTDADGNPIPKETNDEPQLA